MLEMVGIELSSGYYDSFGSPIDLDTQPANQTLWTPASVIEFAMDCIVHMVQTIHLTGADTLAFSEIFHILQELNPWADVWLSTNVEVLRDHTVVEQLIANAPQRIIFHNYQPISSTRTLEIMANVQELKEAGVRTMVYQYASSRISTLQPTAEAYRLLLSVLDMMDIVLVPERPHHAPSILNLQHITDDCQCNASSCMSECHWPVRSCTVSWNHMVNYCPLAGGTVPLPSLDYPTLYKALLGINFKPCYSLSDN